MFFVRDQPASSAHKTKTILFIFFSSLQFAIDSIFLPDGCECEILLLSPASTLPRVVIHSSVARTI